MNSHNKRLKDDACPSVFSWTEKVQERALPAKRAKLDEQRRKLEEEETETASEGEGYFETVDKQRVNRGIQVNLEVECPHTMSLRILKSKCTTQKIEIELFSHYTGFRSYSQFMEFLEFVLPGQKRSKLVYWGTARAKANIIDTALLFGAQNNTQDSESDDVNSENDDEDLDNGDEQVTKDHQLDIEDEFLMFMMRLRLGLTITDLSFRFSLSKATVSTILTTWLNYLFIHLGHLKIWPHRNVLVSHMPKDFKEKYPNNVCIIDCTELKIQVPSSLVKQSQSYSNYKSTNTLKSLVGVDAKGGFIFISQLYTGSISDKQIVSRCGLLNLLAQKVSLGEVLPGDAIMADKGFDIGSELSKLKLKLNIPPFLGSDTQFEESDVIKTQTIAQHRIHVERAIGKVRRFAIFSSPLPVAMLGSVNQLWSVCCLISNFMDPILE